MTKSYTEVNTKLEARSEVVGRRSRSKPGDSSLRSEHAPQSGSLTVPIEVEKRFDQERKEKNTLLRLYDPILRDLISGYFQQYPLPIF